MNSFSDFFRDLNIWGLSSALVTAVAALFCITFHELSHGYVAYKLGDPTAKRAGRLTLNPIRHIDPFGLLMMIVAKVGWAKPVPVDPRYFKDPKKGMALTALAGPMSNFILAFAALGLCSLLYHLPIRNGEAGSIAFLVLACFLGNIAILSAGLGLFNLIPIPPLDGSKVLYSVLPDRIYGKILRYERYIMLLVIVLTLSGVFSKPLSWLIEHTLTGLCTLTGYPEDMLYVTAYILQIIGG